jgi:transcriptional regulator with XRE-family HTH domain
MNTIALFVKQKRKEAGLTQEEFALRSGLGLRFVRDLEGERDRAHGQGQSGIGDVRHEGRSGKDG